MTSSNIKLSKLRNRKSTLSKHKQNEDENDGVNAEKEKSQLLSKS